MPLFEGLKQKQDVHLRQQTTERSCYIMVKMASVQLATGAVCFELQQFFSTEVKALSDCQL